MRNPLSALRVVEATARVVRLPLVHEFQTSSHRKNHLDHILVELVDESGARAWGEVASASDPYYNSETVDTCWTIVTHYLLPALVGRSWRTPAEAEALWGRIRGNFFAKAGVDAACWTLWSTVRGSTLAQALGGTRSEVRVGVSLGIEPTVDDLLAQVQRQVDAGYGRIKLKIAPGWEAGPVGAVRERFPDHDVHVDANGAFRPGEESFRIFAALDSLGLTMIEQPFAPRDFVGSAQLQARLTTPICLDESIETVDDLRTMIKLDAGRILNIKVSRMGGLSAAKQAHDVATAAGIPVWCGGMHEFGIGRAANLALSSLPGFTLPSDVSGSAKYYARDVIDPPVVSHDGVVRVPTEPGLGFGVDLDWIVQNTLGQQTVSADRQ